MYAPCAICLTYKCNNVAAAVDAQDARNYRNESILRYDNQRNASTSFYRQIWGVSLALYIYFFVFCFVVFVYFICQYIKERRALSHTILKFKKLIKTMNAPHNTTPHHAIHCTQCVHTAKPYVSIFLFVCFFERQVSYRCGT